MLRSPSSLDPLAYHQYAFIPRDSGALPMELFTLPFEEVLNWPFYNFIKKWLTRDCGGERLPNAWDDSVNPENGCFFHHRTGDTLSRRGDGRIPVLPGFGIFVQHDGNADG